MPFKGQKIVNKFTNDSIEFLETSMDTNGKRVTVKIRQYNKGKSIGDHIHLIQNESFKVISGRLTYILKGQKICLNAGEEVLLPKGLAHNHYNDDECFVEYIQTISPGIDIDFFLENLFGLMNDGKVKNGKMSFFQTMVTAKYLESPFRLDSIPQGIQNILINIFGSLARLFGYKAIYKRYTGIEK